MFQNIVVKKVTATKLTVVAADVYQIVQNMFVSVQYEPRNLGNVYAVSEPYYGYDSGTSDCRSVSDQLQ